MTSRPKFLKAARSWFAKLPLVAGFTSTADGFQFIVELDGLRTEVTILSDAIVEMSPADYSREKSAWGNHDRKTTTFNILWLELLETIDTGSAGSSLYLEKNRFLEKGEPAPNSASKDDVKEEFLLRDGEVLGSYVPVNRLDGGHAMKLTYDEEANAAYIYVADTIAVGGVSDTLTTEPGPAQGMINLDFDQDSHLLGIEILNASQFLPAAVLRSAR